MAHPDGFGRSQFCAKYASSLKHHEVYLRKVYKAADQMMVDWAGMTMSYTDRMGNTQEVYFFTAVLPASSLIYAEPFLDMKQQAWVEAYINAFEYFGGVPRLVIPDNLKTAVNKVNRYDRSLNKGYTEMARYYGTAILPTRVRAPRDKGPVENAVKNVETRIMARLRNRQFHSFPELRGEVMAALEQVNTTPFQKIHGSRQELFETTERAFLKPLPPSRYEFAVFKMVKVNFDYHVHYEGFYYSVPLNMPINRWKSGLQRAPSRYLPRVERIASHLRTYEPSRRYTTCKEHMPLNHQAMAEWTPGRFTSWAGKIGRQTQAYILWLMGQRDQPEQSFRTCTAILRLADTRTVTAMEQAAEKALQMRAGRVKAFEIILNRITAEPDQPIRHQNIRGAAYYQEAGHA
jgi:transposase